MAQETRDYFRQFIYSQQANHKIERKADPSLLMDLRLPQVVKREEVQEKIHPLLQLANEKKTKASIAVNEIIGQRIRCSTYFEIAKEEQEKQEKRRKRGTRNAIAQHRNVSRDNTNERNNAKTRRGNDEDSDKAYGPPYRPNVLKMEELFADAPAESNQTKKYRYHAGSRSRSKHAVKVMKQIKNEKKKKEREQRKEQEDKEKMDEEVPPLSPPKEIQKPLEKEIKLTVNEPKSTYNDRKNRGEEVKKEQRRDQKSTKSSNREEEAPTPKAKENSSTSKPTSSLQRELAQRQRRVQEREAALLRQQEMLERQREERRIEKQRKQMELRAAKLAKKQEELKRKEAALQKSRRRQEKSKTKKEKSSKKRSKASYEDVSRKSTNSENEDEENWLFHLRNVTNYDPHDRKYKIRDREEIRESSFSRLNKEEARSRKLGVLEEERELQRERKSKKHH